LLTLHFPGIYYTCKGILGRLFSPAAWAAPALSTAIDGLSGYVC
jgi:hypothetical protein